MQVCHSQWCQELKQAANVNLIKTVKSIVQHHLKALVLMEYANVTQALKAEVLRTEAITTCQSNSECQKVCDNPSGAFCIDGKCSCN
jgi:hypothetical protein